MKANIPDVCVVCYTRFNQLRPPGRPDYKHLCSMKCQHALKEMFPKSRNFIAALNKGIK